ncbi:MarR family transcriptional regulator [Chitinophaga caeni]|uniref:MarR family transcriptional regulator n=1 Tax=Chitinophaga caeni TaxID=2029983 RepID=A0A291R044_9BACT|nr:MarR family winged helix-turn-helix transcriptional regulator [Chitinophaga caeni]ATL49464.1 MarR family transcriptional regulator [Chitinophaga caeni]
MGFYHSLGYLIFGSRLRRLSEYFLSEVNKVYEQEGLAFDASWFPVFYILSSKQPVTLMDMATQLEVSHSAISQLVTSLKQKGFVKTSRCKDDGRRQLVVLTKKGEALLAAIQPVWSAIDIAMRQLATEHEESRRILESISAIEQSVQGVPLSERIRKELDHSTNIIQQNNC